MALSAKQSPARIVLIDDEDLLSWCIATELEAQGYAVERAASCLEGHKALAHGPPDLLICDQGLPDGAGLDLIRTALDPRDQVPVIMMTAYTPPPLRALAEVGVHRCLSKPFDLATLTAEVQRCLASLPRVNRPLQS